jgi:HEAT repeat protein
MELEERAKALAGAPLPDFLSVETADQLPLLIHGLVFAKRSHLVEPLVDRLVASLKESSAEMRRQAAASIGRMCRLTSPDTKELFLRRLDPALLDALAAEKDEPTLEALGITAVAFVSTAAATGQPKLLVKLLARISTIPDLLQRLPALKKGLSGVASESPEAVDEIAELISRGDPHLREGAGRVAVLVGASMVPKLTVLIVTSHEVTVRRTAAEAIKAIGGGPQSLTGHVKPEGRAHTIKNVLSVFEVTGPSPRELGLVLKQSSQHVDVTVREAAAALLNRAKTLVTPILISELLASPDGIIQRSAVSVAKDMKIKEAAAGILKIAEQTEAEDLLRGACNYFRECPTKEALPILTRLFTSRTRAFGLMKGMSDPTRVAAVEALRRLDNPEAKKLVDRALTDGSETVRRAAKPSGAL